MTIEELEKLDDEEYEVALAIIALLITDSKTIGMSLRDEVGMWFSRYAEDGKYTYRQARKVLTHRELVRFNARYGSKFKRLTRQSALRYIIQRASAKLREKSHEKLKNLADKMLETEEKAFGATLEDADLINQKWGEDNKSPIERVDAKVDKFMISAQTEVERVMYTSGNAQEAEEAIDKLMLTLASALTLLYTTEGTAMTSFARGGIFKQLGYGFYKFVALRDERTCEVCGSLHGTIFPMSAYMPGITASPMHPRCRCQEVGV